MASIRKYKTAKGEPRFEVRWRDSRGRERCKTFKLLADARRHRIDVERRQQLGPLYEAQPERFGDFLDGWLARYEQTVRPSTYERVVQALRHFDDFAPLYVEQLTAADVQDRVARIGRTAPRQGQMALEKLKQALKNAQERRQRVDEGIFGLSARRIEEREPVFLSWPRVEDLAAACTEERLIVFAASTGLRQGELFALRESALSLDAGEIRVEASAFKGEVARTKTRSARRTVYLSRAAARALREQLLSRRPNELGLVFPAPHGGVRRKDNFMGRVFRPAVRRVELGGLTFHDLRHTYASLMIAAGANPLAIASQLGHKDARLVMSRYGHLYPGAARSAAQLLDSMTESNPDVGEAWGEA